MELCPRLLFFPLRTRVKWVHSSIRHRLVMYRLCPMEKQRRVVRMVLDYHWKRCQKWVNLTSPINDIRLIPFSHRPYLILIVLIQFNLVQCWSHLILVHSNDAPELFSILQILFQCLSFVFTTLQYWMYDLVFSCCCHCLLFACFNCNVTREWINLISWQ